MTERVTGISGPDGLRQLNQSYPLRYPFLLQSTTCDGDPGQFDILFAFPGESLVADGQTPFLDALDTWWRKERIDSTDQPLPFLGGWFVYLGYELAAEIEPSLTLHADPLLPAAFAVRCPVALIYDHAHKACHFVCEAHGEVALQQIRADIAKLPERGIETAAQTPQITMEAPAKFKSAVARAMKYIAAGDVYQANLSRLWSATVSEKVSSAGIYASLCKTNPGPFAGVAHWQDTSIISSSPERLVRVRNGEISTRPIAGTRRRGDNEADDDGLCAELFAHPKERAEHIMLVDLERNDLGRVCEAGSVEVDEMMVLESYAHVHHIVSNVRGRIRPEVTPGAAIAAVFPGGTITGCPKVRCMEIISELENTPRGAYTGSFGYLNRDGSLDLNILIRTMVKHGDAVTFRAGSGIVADSDAAAELDETNAKAEGMLRALNNG